MTFKNIQIEGIGPIIFKKSIKSKKIYIKIDPIKGIYVVFPHKLSYNIAENFVKSKLEWIKKNINKVSEIKEKYSIFFDDTKFRTKYHALEILPEKRATIYSKMTNDKILIKYPGNLNIKEQKYQIIIRDMIIKTLRSEAKKYIPPRVAYWANKYNLKYNKIYFKNAKTRWGSCSSLNNLNFNIHLMRLTDELIDYVILHELVHTIEMNHSKNFWKLLDKYTGNARQLEKKMKLYNTQIF